MAQDPRSRTATEVRREIDAHRTELAEAVDTLRQAADVTSKLRAKLPLVAAGALGAGFFLAGGVGATFRLLARRGREGHERARVGRFTLVDRDH
jgi:hypothetical protein